MTIKELKERALIIYECIAGSRAYGTNMSHSDTDIRGVFILPKEDFYGFKSIDQVADPTNDTVYYELGKFMNLLSKNNPNILELLAMPDENILIKHPIFEKLKVEDFISKRCKNTFGGYAFAQIKKAKGLNKKIVNPMDKVRKTILEFCYVLEGKEVIELNKYLLDNNLRQENIGLVNLPHFSNTFAMFYNNNNEFNYRGIMQKEIANEVCLSSIPKSEKPIAYLSFNKDGYTKYCNDYKAYWDWVEKRNDERYDTNVQHGKNYDSKNMMHTVRLLEMAIEILQDEKIIVKRPNREQLLSIRAGEWEYNDLIKLADSKMAELELAAEKSNLPKNPDTIFIEKLLIEMRNEFYL